MKPGFPPYGERAVEFAGLHRFGAFTMKMYTIDAAAATRPAASWEAALDRIPELLPSGSEADAAHGEGFVILHAGEDAVWLLVQWWADACLLHQRMVAARTETPTDFSLPIPDTLVACSWELAVVHFERDAWVRTVQSLGSDADIEAYRADVMPASAV